MATTNASSHIPRTAAPMTDKLVSTWNPSCRLRILAKASLNICEPPISKPGIAIIPKNKEEKPRISPKMTKNKSGKAIPPPMSRHWSGRMRYDSAGTYLTGDPIISVRCESRSTNIFCGISRANWRRMRSSSVNSTSSTPGC